jgi:hypothetical protein
MDAAPDSTRLNDPPAPRRATPSRASGARGAVPERGARLLAEARWILAALATIALALCLATYHHEDPGFTHATSGG